MLTQILPTRIRRIDQSDFLGSRPSLEFFLTTDGAKNVVVSLKVHEIVTVVFLGKAFERAVLVLRNSVLQIARHADIQHSRAAAHDVHGIAVFLHVAVLYAILAEVPRRGSSVRCIAGDPSAKRGPQDDSPRGLNLLIKFFDFATRSTSSP